MEEPPHSATSLAVPSEGEVVKSPSKGDDPTSQREREREKERAEGTHMKGVSKVHKHGHKNGMESSPRRQSSVPDMISSSPGGSSSSLKDSRDGSSSSLVSVDTKSSYERRIAELESLLDSQRRQSERLEKQLAHERAITAEMEVSFCLLLSAELCYAALSPFVSFPFANFEFVADLRLRRCSTWPLICARLRHVSMRHVRIS